MSDVSQRELTSSFAKTFALPALLIFLVPIASLLFFRHAQSQFDAEAREVILGQIREDATLPPEERERAIEHFTEHPVSELVQDEEFAANLEPSAVRDYATFRWMIWLSWWSIVAGLVVCALAGLCALLSRRSQQAQYLSLSVGWHVLRVYGAMQTVIQGVLLVALSFWVTALWFNIYIPKLIFIVGFLALAAAFAVIKAIFKRPETKFEVSGEVITNETAGPLWNELNSICKKVGTEPPDQIIAGIDDNFFVTEMPVTVDGETYYGRTLYVSLSMLKQMRGAEADAVLAHEMAHFSGQDTLYSKRISPLLVRYGMYLESLYQGGLTRPIFHFMHFFRALFELSLGKNSRLREFRADKIAAEVTSPRDFAGSLLRVSAYSTFLQNIQKDLFKEERELASANILARMDDGFQQFAVKFASDPNLGSIETSHPFDSHPTLSHRLDALGVPLKSLNVEQLLNTAVAGQWYQRIEGAEQLERRQWDELEQRFRAVHEESLAYRFLPETEEERAVVERSFPAMGIEGKKCRLDLDYESVNFTSWPDAILFREIANCTVDDNGVLHIYFSRGGKQHRTIKLTKSFAKPQQQEAFNAISRYYSRYMNAAAYQAQKQHAGEPGEGPEAA